MSMAYMIYFPIMPNFPNAYYKQSAVLGATKKIKIKKNNNNTGAGLEEASLPATAVYNDVKIAGIWTKIGPRYSKTIPNVSICK